MIQTNQISSSDNGKAFKRILWKKPNKVSTVFDIVQEEEFLGVVNFTERQLLYVNPCISKLSGYSENELMRMRFIDLVHPDSQDIVQRNLRQSQYKKSDSFHLVVKAKKKTGSDYWLEVDISTFFYKGKKTFLAFLYDITEKQKLHW